MRKFILPLLLGTTLSLASLSASADPTTTQAFWVRVSTKGNVVVATDNTHGGTHIPSGTAQDDFIRILNDVAGTSTKDAPSFTFPEALGKFNIVGKAIQNIKTFGDFWKDAPVVIVASSSRSSSGDEDGDGQGNNDSGSNAGSSSSSSSGDGQDGRADKVDLGLPGNVLGGSGGTGDGRVDGQDAGDDRVVEEDDSGSNSGSSSGDEEELHDGDGLGGSGRIGDGDEVVKKDDPESNSGSSSGSSGDDGKPPVLDAPKEKKGPGVVSRAVTSIKNYMSTHDPLMVAAPTFALLNWYKQNQTIAFENDPNAPGFANVAAYMHHELTKGSLVPYAQVPHIFAGLINSPLTKGTSAIAIAVPAAFDSMRFLSHAYQLVNDPTYAAYLHATTTASDVVDSVYSPLVLASLLSSKVAPLALAIPVGKMTGDVVGHVYDALPESYDAQSYVSRETVTSVANPLAVLTTIIAGYKAGAEFSGVRRAMLAYGLYQGAQTLQTYAGSLSDYPIAEAGVLTATVTWGGPLGWAAALGYGALQTEVGQTWVAKPFGHAISSVRSYIAAPQQQDVPVQ